jgi:hypothetical protein
MMSSGGRQAGWSARDKAFERALIVAPLLISLLNLALFRIEQWGGGPDPAEEAQMKLVGLVILLILYGVYVVTVVAESVSWVGVVAGLGAFVGLAIWNENFAWLNPATNPSFAARWFAWLLPKSFHALFMLHWGLILKYHPLKRQAERK